MILEVRQVTRRFGGLVALDRLAFGVAEGEILGLIGPNGAGKSTLFNVVSGVHPPQEGEVAFRGRSLAGLAPHLIARLGIARTYQVVRPLSELSVRENVMVGACFGRYRQRLGPAAGVADEVLEFVGLAPKRAAFAGRLNLAEKKRLELARAVAARPGLLLLDEVLAGLNPSEVGEMLEVLRALRARGVTIVMIEHLMEAVMNVSDRVVALDHGALIAAGTPAEVTNDARVIEAYLGDPAAVRRLVEGAR